MPVPRAHTACWLLAVVAWGCSSKLEIQTIRRPDAPALVPKYAGCRIEVHPEGYRFEPGCREVGGVFVGDTAWSTDCGWDRVLDVVREEACAFGADAAQIVAHHEPSVFGSSCHQVRARFMVCSHEPQHD